MADNRLFLIHQPSCLGVMIAKRLFGWDFREAKDSPIDDFFEMIDVRGDFDDIVLFNEETNYGEPWEYDGVRTGKFQKFRKAK